MVEPHCNLMHQRRKLTVTFCTWIHKHGTNNLKSSIESVDSISRDERGFPLTQYITNGGISRAGYNITHFKHNHRVL